MAEKRKPSNLKNKKGSKKTPSKDQKFRNLNNLFSKYQSSLSTKNTSEYMISRTFRFSNNCCLLILSKYI